MRIAKTCDDCYNVTERSKWRYAAMRAPYLSSEMSTPGATLPAKQTSATRLAQSDAGNSYSVNPDAALEGGAKARYVSGMFARIARRYDFMNVLMSFGQDAAWRRFAVRKARPRPGDLALDVA